MAETPDLRAAVQQMADSMALIGVLGEVSVEVFGARAKHGKQADMAFGTGADRTYVSDLVDFSNGDIGTFTLDNEEAADAAKALEQATSAEKRPTWANVLGEEFFEALAEDDWPKLRAELIQVAAMATSWITIGDERARA